MQNNHTRTEYSVLNILTGVGGYALNTLLGFICRMVFVKYLSADYLGVNGLFTNILTMLSLAELGQMLKEPVGKSGVNYRLNTIIKLSQ